MQESGKRIASGPGSQPGPRIPSENIWDIIGTYRNLTYISHDVVSVVQPWRSEGPRAAAEAAEAAEAFVPEAPILPWHALCLPCSWKAEMGISSCFFSETRGRRRRCQECCQGLGIVCGGGSWLPALYTHVYTVGDIEATSGSGRTWPRCGVEAVARGQGPVLNCFKGTTNAPCHTGAGAAEEK